MTRYGRPSRRSDFTRGGGVLLVILGLAAPVASAAGAPVTPPFRASPAQADVDGPPLDRGAIDRLIDAAARRFGVPADWIRAVMRQESGFDPQATSPAGAMGLMQVMPATWAELRVRYGLGADPYEPRDNIMAGAAYLRELYDRFGSEGMLPAYNAGPGRYLQHRDEGRPLPLETRDYVRRIGRLNGPSSTASHPRSTAAQTVDPASAPLFPPEPGGQGPASNSLFIPGGTGAAPAVGGGE